MRTQKDIMLKSAKRLRKSSGFCENAIPQWHLLAQDLKMAEQPERPGADPYALRISRRRLGIKAGQIKNRGAKSPDLEF
jgi:hypothetical protein